MRGAPWLFGAENGARRNLASAFSWKDWQRVKHTLRLNPASHKLESGSSHFPQCKIGWFHLMKNLTKSNPRGTSERVLLRYANLMQRWKQISEMLLQMQDETVFSSECLKIAGSKELKIGSTSRKRSSGFSVPQAPWKSRGVSLSRTAASRLALLHLHEKASLYPLGNKAKGTTVWFVISGVRP